MKYHFEHKESYLHEHAKLVLKTWIIKYPERFGLKEVVSVRSEECFSENGIVIFRPDITVYNSERLIHIYEICHTSPITGEKLNRIMFYLFMNEQTTIIFEIGAEYIMRQIKCPTNIKMQKFEIFNDKTLF